MGFFAKFPTVSYSLDGYSKDAMNLLTAAIVKRLRVDMSYVHKRYTVSAGTTPESLAFELYRNAELYWTILLVNAIVDPFNDWIMDADTLEKTVRAVHGSPNKIIYFRDQKGRQYDDVDSARFQAMLDAGERLPQNVFSVTALMEASERNQEKAQIVVVDPKYINQFVDMFNKAIQGK